MIAATTKTAITIPMMIPIEESTFVSNAKFKPTPLVRSSTFCSVNTIDLEIGRYPSGVPEISRATFVVTPSLNVIGIIH